MRARFFVRSPVLPRADAASSPCKRAQLVAQDLVPLVSRLLGTHKFASATAAAATAETFETVSFPRAGPGISYALNWALAIKDVPPKGLVFRNLKESELVEHGANASADKISGCSIYVNGNTVEGGININKPQFNKLFKQVKSHLSSRENLFVHDGAVGSYPHEDVRTRCICDEPSAALVIKNILCRTPTREVNADSYPLTIYAAEGLIPSVLEQFGFPTNTKAQHGFAIADHDQSTLILGGKVFHDNVSLKNAIAAVAAKNLASRGVFALAARILVRGDSIVLLLAPEPLIQSCPSLLDMCVTKDANTIWSLPGGLGTFFSVPHSQAPNLFKAPASVVLVTVDSSGAIPPISQLTPGQAAYHFLAAYNGKSFVPAYQYSLSFLDPLSLSKQLLEKLSSSTSSAYLLNASEGDKVMGDERLIKLIDMSISQKAPKSDDKKPSEGAVEALKSQYSSFLTAKFSELPEEMAF